MASNRCRCVNCPSPRLFADFQTATCGIQYEPASWLEAQCGAFIGSTLRHAKCAAPFCGTGSDRGRRNAERLLVRLTIVRGVWRRFVELNCLFPSVYHLDSPIALKSIKSLLLSQLVNETQ